CCGRGGVALCRHRIGNCGDGDGGVFRLARRSIEACNRKRRAAALRGEPRTSRRAAGRGYRRRRARSRLSLESMPIQIPLPALSTTMTEGNLTKWLKKEGDEVHSGDVLAEIETDKATMEFEAVDDGRVGKILVPEGAQGIKVNQPIAVLLGEGEDASALDKF